MPPNMAMPMKTNALTKKTRATVVITLFMVPLYSSAVMLFVWVMVNQKLLFFPVLPMPFMQPSKKAAVKALYVLRSKYL